VLDVLIIGAGLSGIGAARHLQAQCPNKAWRIWEARSQIGGTVQQQARMLHMCGGYYSYAQGHQPEFAGQADFKGQVINPQFWPADLDFAGKQVVVIGSGATAMTMVPAMAHSAAHVTMLQRSPTYVVSRPGRDPFPQWLQKGLPVSWAYRLTRWKNILQSIFYFQLARRQPAFLKRYLVALVGKALGQGFDVQTHFTPRYNPWTQRVCALPDGDLFKAIRGGRASVVTDTVAHFTATGLVLQGGGALAADVVVLATGLQLNVLADIAFTVDGKPFVAGDAYSYKGMMLSGLPNVVLTFGYSNASWTLKADLIADFACRLLNHMDKHAFREVRPTPARPMTAQPFMDFDSGYVTRASIDLPKQGDHGPWRVHQNYLMDLWAIGHGSLDDRALRFSRL